MSYQQHEDANLSFIDITVRNWNYVRACKVVTTYNSLLNFECKCDFQSVCLHHFDQRIRRWLCDRDLVVIWLRTSSQIFLRFKRLSLTSSYHFLYVLIGVRFSRIRVFEKRISVTVLASSLSLHKILVENSLISTNLWNVFRSRILSSLNINATVRETSDFSSNLFQS